MVIEAVLILRPQPGADRTAERARARGLEPVVAPLFTIAPVEWSAPAGRYDAILFTSANGPRRAGDQLSAWHELPAYAVGEASALAAREAGFADVRTGPSDGNAVAAMMAGDGVGAALHLGGEDVTPLDSAGIAITHVPVYRAEPLERLPDVAVSAMLSGAVVLLHSPRAASLFASLVNGRREATCIAAISDAAAAAAGPGWAAVAVAIEPRDEALLEAAHALILSEATRTEPQPPPPMANAPAGEVFDAPVPRRRNGGWLWLLILALLLFAGGAAAGAWLLTRWDAGAAWLGLAEPPERIVVAAPPQQPAEPVSPEAPEIGGSGTIVIDPDVARRVAALEQRIGELGSDARTAVGNADRAEGLLLAFAARRALDRGVGLGSLEGPLRERFGGAVPRAVETVIAASRRPVTLQSLQEQLAAAAPAASAAAGSRGLWQALKAEAANLVRIRRTGTPSADPVARIDRASERLAAGQVEIALAEVMRLPGRDGARDWIEAAQRYVTARQALDVIELAALTEPRPVPVPTAPAPSAAVP